jgi:RNA polymerase sigma-32 factor
MGQAIRSETQESGVGYIRAAMDAPLLSREREHELAVRWRSHGDEAALHQLIRSYARLVAGMAARYRNYGLAMSDLLQEGNIGLMLAASRFEPERGLRFSTYAAWWVRSQMQEFVLRNWSIVRTGTTSAHKSLFFNMRRLRARIENRSGEPLSDSGRQAIAEELGVPLRDVNAMEQRMTAVDRSLDIGVGEDGGDPMLDFLSDTRPNPEQSTISAHDATVRRRAIDAALGELPSRERRIVVDRLLSEKGTTLDELGRELGVSKERVRQLEMRALNRLRASISRYIAQPSDLWAEA